MFSACLFAQVQPADDEAQQDASDPFHPKTSIVVTGTRTQTELAESPVSASVLTRNELELRNTRTLDQGLTLMEGLYAFRQKGAADSLAGVGMRGFDGRGSSQVRTLILLDGQPMNDGYTGGMVWATLPVMEVDRVEVARGPFSSLYGGNAMGGVINVITRPVVERHFDLDGQYGSNASREYTLRYSDRFWKRLGFSLGYQRQQYGGYSVNKIFASPSTLASTTSPLIGAPEATLTSAGARRYIVGEQGDNWYNQHSLRSKLDYTFSPNTTASAQFIWRRYGYGYDGATSLITGADGQLKQSGTFYFNDGTLRKFSLTPGAFLSGPGEGESRMLNLQLSHSFSPRQIVRLSGGVQDVPYDYYLTPSSTALAASGPGQTAERPNRSWRADAQWNWAISPRQDLTAGAEFRHDQASIIEYNLSNWAIRDSHISQSTYGRGKSVNEAQYAQYRFAVTRRLRISAGGRVDYWKGYDGLSIASLTASPVIYPERSESSVSGKLAAAFDAGHDWTLRASVGNAFRNPTVYELYRSWRSATGTIYLSNPALEPETMKSWEFGLRKRVAQWLEADAAYYENRIHNLIYRAPDLVTDPNGATQRYFNASEGRTRGAELALRERLNSWLFLRETYTITDARILKNDYTPAVNGRRVPYVPRNIASASIVAARRGWSASVNGQYFGRIYSTDANTDIVKGVYGAYDPFFVMDATVSREFEKHLTLFVSVQNLLDRTYHEYYLSPGRTASVGMRIHL
jgi:iron complex outermembrane receptor protein